MSAPRQELQLLLVRLGAGLAFLPAALPKLFQGLAARTQFAQQLNQLGIAHGLQIAVVAGLIELALCLMLTLGYCTRATGLIAALYLVATMYLGTWPHSLPWMLVCASLVVAGGGRWSVDGWLKSK